MYYSVLSQGEQSFTRWNLILIFQLNLVNMILKNILWVTYLSSDLFLIR